MRLRDSLRFELAATRRGRTVPALAIGFAAVSVGVALAGLTAGGVVAVQGFARTSVSLLQLTLWVVPLLGLPLGAVAGAECYDLEFVTGLPVTRGRIVTARWLAWWIALGAALAVGFGGAGLVIAAFAGAADGLRYLALVAVAEALLGATLALGVWLGLAAKSRARAVGVAVAAWFVLVVGVDLAAVAALAVLPVQGAGWGLSALLLADPVDSARALALGLFQADVLSGPTGAALRHVLGGWGGVALVAGLVLWTALPLAAAGRRFARADL